MSTPMPRRLLVLLICAACSAPVRSHPVEQVQRIVLSPPIVDSEPSVHAKPGVDLSGVWARGSTNEPAVRQFVLRLQCNYTPSYWVIEQTGDTVRSWTSPASQAQGIARPLPPRPVVAKGRIRGVDVRMTDGSSRYALAYDAASGHLRGTLNGAPFWAVRQELVRAEGCLPVP
jgi:hypothetical protein